MFHTPHIPRRACGTCLLRLNHISNSQISTSASRQKTKFDLSDDLTNGPHDLIGPPRPASNLRPIKFAVCILQLCFKNEYSIGEGRGVSLGKKAEGFEAGDTEVQPGLVDQPQQVSQ